MQNSLVHRSWLKPAPIRLLVFDDRVEIISPGALPNNLTVDDIKLGNAYQRNQLIATLCAKTMDYRGLGSGIIRALQSESNIEFHNEVSGDQFRVILWRSSLKSDLKSKEETSPEVESKEKSSLKSKEKTSSEVESKEKSSLKSKEKILEILQLNPKTTTSELILLTELSRSGVEKILRQLKESGKIRRVGPDKGGHWEVCEQ